LINSTRIGWDNPILLACEGHGWRCIERGTDSIVDKGVSQSDLPCAIASRAGEVRPVSGQSLCRNNIGKRNIRDRDSLRVLVPEKEKQFVLLDGSPDHASKLMAFQLIHFGREC